MGNEQSTMNVGHEGTRRRWLVRRKSKSVLSSASEIIKVHVEPNNGGDDDEHITYEKGLGRMPEHVVSDANLQGAALTGIKVVRTTSVFYPDKVKPPTWTVPINPTPYDIQYALHIALKYMLQRSPIAQKLHDGIKVLEINSNAGAWCIDMAKLYPASEFIGCHWEADFPDTITPYNCTFQVANPMELPFEEDTFDFVYQRRLKGPYMYYMDRNVWQKLTTEVQRVAKPDAYIEFMEPEYIFYRCGPASLELQRQITNCVRHIGIDAEGASKIESYFTSADLHNVNMTYLSVPIGAWAGPIGKLHKADWDFQLGRSRELLLNTIQVEKEEFDQLKEKALEEVEEFYTYLNWYMVYGQKPWTRNQ